MIPQETIEQIRQATDIVDIISQYLRLKKRGRNYFAVCPFHVEKSASFSIAPEKQIYHCFGCGASGNVFSFLMQHENMTFIEAVKSLAQRAGITIREEKRDDSVKEEIEKLHFAMNVAIDYYKSLLFSDDYGSKVMTYLTEKRKITGPMIEHFQLGLSGESWDGFLKYALQKGLYPGELESAGLIIHNEKRDSYFDRFRQRLMIPIFNQSGKSIAFGGRALKKGESAKYMNSPETRLYNKSYVLYGLNFSRQSIREKNEVIIVEGYFDLISLFQAGITNVAASSGTAFTLHQARLLAHFADTAYLFFDADSAGQSAAIRSVDALYDAGLEVKVMVPPEGEDPDSMAVKGGTEAIENLRTGAKRFLDFRIGTIDLKSAGIIEKEKLIKELAILASKIGDTTRRELFITEASDLLKAPAHAFHSLMAGLDKRTGPSTGEIHAPKKMPDIERDLLSLVLCFPEYFEKVKDKIIADDFLSDMNKKLYSFMLSIHRDQGEITGSILIDKIDDNTLKTELTRLLSIDWEGMNIPATVKGYIRKIQGFKREKTIDRLKGELKIAEEKGDAESSRRLEAEIMDLIKRRE